MVGGEELQWPEPMAGPVRIAVQLQTRSLWRVAGHVGASVPNGCSVSCRRRRLGVFAGIGRDLQEVVVGKARVSHHVWPHGRPVGTVPSGRALTSLLRAGPVVAPMDPKAVDVGVSWVGLRERALQKELAEVGVWRTLASLQPTKLAARLEKVKATARKRAGQVLPRCVRTYALTQKYGADSRLVSALQLDLDKATAEAKSVEEANKAEYPPTEFTMSLRYTRRLNKAARNVDATEQKLEASKALQKTIAEQIAAQEAELAHWKQVLQRIRSEQPQARDAERLREDFKTHKSVEERLREAFANSFTPDGGVDGFQMRDDVSDLMAELAAKSQEQGSAGR